MRPKTTHMKAGEIAHDWHLADAEGQVLGRLAVQIAMILMGKHRPTYSEHLDCGDAVVVVNAEKIAVTGSKAVQKEYARFSGYAGGHKITTYAKMLEEHPDRILLKAVERMLPKNRLRRPRMAKLFVYVGGQHPHGAQQPKPLTRAT
jgi:large subunit ribosomal protein L13